MSQPKWKRELDDFDAVFKALSHESRRHILAVLNARGGSMTASSIAQRFACSWPTTTRHLRVLESAGLVVVRKRGRERHYVLATERMHSVVNQWLRYFEPIAKE